jgi:phosphatidylinositol-3,4,5-trisphosphate 3-phosphatase/dual-specificity protein phosphatase PTEN
VHCNSGKGRTGTAIVCFLLFCGFFDNVDDALKFYGQRRFTCGKGVSQPCQLRYVYYFESFYKKIVKSPAVKRLRGIQFDRIPNMSNNTCTPFFEVFHCNGMNITKTFVYPAEKKYTKDNDKGIIFTLTEEQKMSFSMRGDTKIMFNHKTTNMFRIMFNTSFIQNGNYIHAGKMELSPEDIRKDNGKILPDDFKIYIFFEDFC